MSDSRRSVRFTFRLRADQLAELRAAALAQGLEAGELARRLILRGLGHGVRESRRLARFPEGKAAVKLADSSDPPCQSGKRPM
jgi:hypothetical protein